MLYSLASLAYGYLPMISGPAAALRAATDSTPRQGAKLKAMYGPGSASASSAAHMHQGT